MAAIERFCSYPELNGYFHRPGGQDSFKRCIREFDQLMLDVGLIRSDLENQLDTNDIPDIDINSCFTNLAQRWGNNATDIRRQTAIYPPLEYIFDDELQTDYPVKIKIEFMFFRRHRSYDRDPEDKPLFGNLVTVYGPNSETIIPNVPFLTDAAAIANDDSWPSHEFYSANIEMKTMISYDKEKGYLFINHCPGHKIYQLRGSDGGVSSPVTFLCLNRSKNYNGEISGEYLHIIYKKIKISSTNANANWNVGSSAFNNSNSDVFDSTIISYIPNIPFRSSTVDFFIQNNSEKYLMKGDMIAYQSNILDINNNLPVNNPFVLVCNKNLGGNIYNVRLNDTEVKKYVAISQHDVGGYAYNSNQTLMFYFN